LLDGTGRDQNRRKRAVKLPVDATLGHDRG
jgi:hypothetical protein